MFKWFKGLFTGEPQNNSVKTKKDISEPVISFVECVKKNPKRFAGGTYSTASGSAAYINDYQTGETFYFGSFYLQQFAFREIVSNTCMENVLTKEEKDFVIEELATFAAMMGSRRQRRDQLREQRKAREERKRLMEIYCK